MRKDGRGERKTPHKQFKGEEVLLNTHFSTSILKYDEERDLEKEVHALERFHVRRVFHLFLLGLLLL